MTASTFLEDLARWGPDWYRVAASPALAASGTGPQTGDVLSVPVLPPGPRKQAVSEDEAAAYCRQLASTHYENFPVLSWLLPRDLRQPFANVYAYCRWADDLGDEIGDRRLSQRLLDWWRAELDRCCAGAADHPVFVALGPTIRDFAIPSAPFHDLISAFEQDQIVTEYDTFDQLRDYCRRSADPVGRLVLFLCRSFTDEHAAWSDSICTGLQLANFWQDVARDWRIGRVYLPAEDRARFGVSRAVIERGQSTPEFTALMAFEVERARQWLTAGLPLVARLPGRLAMVVDLFARGGLKILERIERQQYRVLEHRPEVTKLDVLRLSCGTLWRHVRRSSR